MKIDAVAVASKDLQKTVAFYRLLGFEFGDIKADDKHIEPLAQKGQVRLMIDDADLLKSITGVEPKPATHSHFAILCDSVEQVNEIATKIKDAGHTIVKEPWDAFWGQRYAIVQDPDGYMIDLFAPLE